MIERINLSDVPNIISEKNKKINDFINDFADVTYSKELSIIKQVLENISGFLSSKQDFHDFTESFSGQNGRLIYVFKHENRPTSQVYISPKIYLTSKDTIVYEVYNPEQYLKYSKNAKVLKGQNNVLYCETDVFNIIQVVSLEEILTFLDKYINQDFEEYAELANRIAFLEKITGK